MTYQQALDYLYARLPMFSRIGPAAYKKDLHNTIRLLEAFDNPHQNFKSIHIAGTNGKGSTSHMMASILQAEGYRTGLYTSPHLFDFRERFKINGRWIDADFVAEFTQKCKPLIEEIEPSFFEVTVAMAFQWFAAQKVDYAIIETGLGGRLDSTNVITPLLSVITNIGFDHMNLLGNTLQEIAFEKAGIIKQAVPAIIGEVLPETRGVFAEKAALVNAPVLFANDEWRIQSAVQKAEGLEVCLAEKGGKAMVCMETDLPGAYQQQNLRTVYACVEALRMQDICISDGSLHHGLRSTMSSTGLFGRWQRIAERPLTITDVAHNKHGMQQVVNQIEDMPLQREAKVHFVTGMVNDKDVDSVLQVLPRNFTYYFTQAQIPRAMPAEDLQQRAFNLALHGERYADVNAALHAARKNAAPHDLVMVAGSVFLVGELSEVRAAILQQQQSLAE